MTREEFRKSEEYKTYMDKIKKYKKGFKFTLHYSEIPKAKVNALNVLTNDCIELGILESISTGIGLDLEVKDETFRRI